MHGQSIHERGEQASSAQKQTAAAERQQTTGDIGVEQGGQGQYGSRGNRNDNDNSNVGISDLSCSCSGRRVGESSEGYNPRTEGQIVT